MEKKISLRLSDENLEVIDSFIAGHDFSNRSEFLREAALDYIEKYSGPTDQREIPERIKLPKRLRNSIYYLIHMGHYNNWQDAIHELVREGLLDENIEELEKQYDGFGKMSDKVETFKKMAEEEKEYMRR
ncbi:MAG: ribbon-helix-helix protein, CopG family [Candidatus Thermoplasmatota archaeon]|nr:ribbon-helix-helix protein, CopG family [Candidatus Thermoplasmatota archaeon]